MTAVVFETPGLLDVRAITIMGAHAKPNLANPIGFFGTGLKYAIAVAVRLGAEPVIWIGRDRFSFSTYSTTFRGLPLETVKMKVLRDGAKRASYFELPFTTRYGASWKPWMAFRELESNTRDENGRTVLIDEPGKWDLFHGGPAADKTYIVIDHPDFVEAAEKIDETFLPRGRRGGVLLEAFDGESERGFYRTMRAMDLGKPSLFTYNVLETLALTEDRTVKYAFQFRDVVARWVLTEATVDQVEAVLKADDGYWEHGLELPGNVAPSEAFRTVMTERRRGLPKLAWSYYGRYAGPRAVKPRNRLLFEEHPKPWRVEGTAVLDANGEEVFVAPDGYYEDWGEIADKILLLLRAHRLSEPAVAAIINPVSESKDGIPF